MKTPLICLLLILNFLFACNQKSGRCLECTGLTSAYSACEESPSELSPWSPNYIENGNTWEDHVAAAMLSAQIFGNECTETFN